MYPLNMHNPVAAGYAVANDEAEHKALTAAGYLPPLTVTNEYADGTVAPGPGPLPDESPAAPVKRGPGRPRKVVE